MQKASLNKLGSTSRWLKHSTRLKLSGSQGIIFTLVGNLIYNQFLTARDWPFGSALAMILIAVMLLLLLGQALLVGRAQGEGRARLG